MIKRKLSVLEISLAGMFVALMAIGANITSIVPFLVIGGVPITLQTFFSVLAGATLGSRLGAISMAGYMALGLVGAPVFARFNGGITSLLNPTFGFVVSYIFIAFIIGKLVERKTTLKMFITASFIGMVINYLFGTNWLYIAYKFWADAPDGFTYQLAWLWMVPPLPKDIILSIFAGMFAYRLEHSVFSRSQFRKIKRSA